MTGPHGMVTAAWRGEGDRQGLLQKVTRAGSPTHRSIANADAGLERAHTSAYFSCSKSHFPEPAGAYTCTPMCVDMHTTHGNTHTQSTQALRHIHPIYAQTQDKLRHMGPHCIHMHSYTHTHTHTHTHTCCCRPSFHTQAHTLKSPVLRTALSGDRNVYAPQPTAICLLSYERADARM